MRKGMGWAAVMLGLALAGPAGAHDKRADRCGCHHQYGLRHCHPGKKTRACEAPAKAKQKPKAPAPEKQEAAKGVRL